MKNSTFKLCAMLLAICTSTIHLQAMDEWDGKTIAKGFYSGTGTKTDPFRIFTASQFLYFLQQTKDGNTFSNQYIELCNDIAFKSNNGLVEGGDFYGDFDGNDHKIQVNKYWEEYYDYIWGGWYLFNLYGSVHDVIFVRANQAIKIYTEGVLYNCKFEFPGGVSGSTFYTYGYHGQWIVSLAGGTIANCVSNSASWRNRLEQGGSRGLVAMYADGAYGKQAFGYCSNCYFPIDSYDYGGGLAPNYNGTVESCGEEAGNDWVQSHTERTYKSWPLTFNPTYPEYQIQEHPKSYNPSVVYTHSDEALYQWYYQKRKPITFEDIKKSYSTQTKNIVVLDDDMILSFDFKAYGDVYLGYNDGDDTEAWISVNGEKIVSVYKEIEGTYSCQLSAGTCEISCECSDISNICLTYPTETLTNETSSTLSKQTIMAKSGAYFCQVSYGAGCDVMNSDYVDYEKLLTIDDVTYVVNEDSTATVLWATDMAVDITIPETVNYNDVNCPVTSISSTAFVDCTSLKKVNCKSSDVPALLGGTTFEELIPSDITLYVPVGSESAYSAANGWKEFSEILGIETEVDPDPETYSAFVINDTTVMAGSAFTMPVELKNSCEVTAFQCDIYLPEGISLQKNNKDKYEISLDENRKDDHTITIAEQPDGSIRIVVASLSSSTFSGTEGTLFNMGLLVADDTSGEKNIAIKNVYISEANGKRHDLADAEATVTIQTYTPADVNNDGMIAIDDVVLTINTVLGNVPENFVFDAADMNGDGRILIDDVVRIINVVLGIYAPPVSNVRRNDVNERFILNQKETGVGISVSNAAGYTAMQYDMYLPEGAEVSDVRFSGKSNHKVTFRKINENVVRVIVVSLTNEVFSGNELLDVVIDTALDTEISIKDANVATRSGIKGNVQDASINIGGNTTAIDQLLDGMARADVHDLNGRLVKKNASTITDLQKGIYIINGKRIIR